MLQPIETEDEYTSVLSFVYELMQTDLKQDVQASGDMDTLSLLIHEYSAIHYPASPK